MNYDDFFREAGRLNLAPPKAYGKPDFHSSLDNEALFQLPLLAMVILTLSKGSSKPKIAELGQLVGECLERTVAGFKGSSQEIGWSANLRIRTVRALLMLERAGLLRVNQQDGSDGSVAIEPPGRSILAHVLEQESPLANALLIVERSFENIRAERRILSEV